MDMVPDEYLIDNFHFENMETQEAHRILMIKRLIQDEFDKSASAENKGGVRGSRIGREDLDFLVKNSEKSYQFFNGLIYMRQSVLLTVLSIFLVLFLFMERFSFFMLVYKTQCLNYIPLIITTIVNCVILFF
jgi:hypothetical protein